MNSEAPSPRVVVATYNVHGGIGTDRRYDPHRTAAVLQELGADIIALQEVDSRPRGRRRGRRSIDQFGLFEQATGYHTIVGPNIILGLSKYGNALLSRWPIRRFALHDLSVPGCEPRGAIEAEIDVNGMALRVVNTHFGLRRRERRNQILRLAELLGHGRRLPTIVMGDFNFWGRDAGALRVLGHPAMLSAPTWPARYPVLRLDRIWSRPTGLCTGATVHRTELARRASDHLPLVASVALPGHSHIPGDLPGRQGQFSVGENRGEDDDR